MGNKHNNIKRLIHRMNEEIGSTYKISRNTSIFNFPKIFLAKVINYRINKRGTPESSYETKCLMEKHRILMSYFEKVFHDFVVSYEFDDNSLLRESKYRDKIWVCWWQGLDQAPEIVQRCIASIRKNAGKYEVVVLDDFNYKQYVHIPKWMEKKKDAGIITKTHFSDFLRLELLAEHGGIWLDATFFTKNFDVAKIMELPVWSIKRPDYGHLSVACGYFANYSFGCNYENRKAFGIIRDYLLEYWKNNSRMVDYLFLDYLIELAIQHDDYLSSVFANIPDNNPACDELVKVLGKPYDEVLWKKLCQDTQLFKLSWKQQFPLTKGGQKTFYSMLIDDML